MNEYLIRAEYACDYVKNTVRMKTENNAAGINKVHSKIYSNLICEKLDSDRARTLSLFNTWSAESVEYRANLAEQSQMGNCDEQAIVAFNYLRLHGEKGMALMRLNTKHIFVLLGLQEVPPLESSMSLFARFPEKWGKNVVICDPWYQEWFIAQRDWRRKIDCMIGEGKAYSASMDSYYKY
ncbi:MAG: hypothetical protein KAH18_13365 [Psychromonas sp.]|nr:hypothetical protein [Psychromonas sp.]